MINVKEILGTPFENFAGEYRYQAAELLKNIEKLVEEVLKAADDAATVYDGQEGETYEGDDYYVESQSILDVAKQVNYGN